MRSSIPLSSFLALTITTGCLDQVYDGSDDADVVDRIPAQPLPLEGSTTAFGMLRVVNELSFPELDLEVELDRRAAEAITTFRAGEDRHFGTQDDRYFGSLADLDAEYWLGDANLWAIQRYAVLEGYTPEALPEAGCTPALVEMIDACIRSTEVRAGAEVTRDELVSACLVQSEPEAPSGQHFASLGLPGFGDPWMGYFARLCAHDAPHDDCELGVAGIVELRGPACDAVYDAS